MNYLALHILFIGLKDIKGLFGPRKVFKTEEYLYVRPMFFFFLFLVRVLGWSLRMERV
jgi:hypothetical protein